MMVAQKSTDTEEEKEKATAAAAFVKVSMDGAPYLRKVDLKNYSSYKQLSDALGKMFSSFTMGKKHQFSYIYCETPRPFSCRS